MSELPLDLGQARLIPDQADLYETVTEVINNFEPSSASGRSLLIASLHGHDGPRWPHEIDEGPRLEKAVQMFAAAFTQRVSNEAQPWTLKQVVNVMTEQRLDQVLGRQLELKGRKHYVRAYSSSALFPVISPLIIGNHHVFLALDDDRLFRAASAVWIEGLEAAAWARQYFDRVWEHAPFNIRGPVGTQPDQVEGLRRTLRSRKEAGERGAGDQWAVDPQMWSRMLMEVGRDRNLLEKSLRRLVAGKFRALAERGTEPASEIALKTLPPERRARLAGLRNVDDLLDKLFWLELAQIVRKHWREFEKVFNDRDKFNLYADIVNDRPDAHAKEGFDAADLALHRRGVQWLTSRIAAADG